MPSCGGRGRGLLGANGERAAGREQPLEEDLALARGGREHAATRLDAVALEREGERRLDGLSYNVPVRYQSRTATFC